MGRLADAMRHSVFAGGKRLRPFLVIETARMLGAEGAAVLRTASAVEMIHAYSLIHDDLPAMDDADLRRGKPSCHVAFDEATAILAGDALQALAFEVLAAPEPITDAAMRAALVHGLGRAAGALGMCGGQMIDLASEGEALTRAELEDLQARKTGALIAFACDAGAILAGANEGDRAAVGRYAEVLGRAFQIADDVLDASGDAAAMGKAAGADSDAGKATFVAVLGLDNARAEARRLADDAAAALAPFGCRADLLRAAADFAVNRSN